MSEPVAVLLGARIPPESLEQVRAAALAGGRPADLLLYRDHAHFLELLARAEVVYGRLRAGEAAAAPHLRWVHCTSAGVDGWPLGELRAAGVTLTNARGQHADPMADHAFALLLALSRRIAESVRHQAAARWQSTDPEVLAGRRLGILGFGAIGQAVARRGRAFGMQVWATRRHPGSHPLVDRMLGPSRAELLECLGACDDVVAVLPSTPETRGLLDGEAFAAMRPGARLINLGRGDVLVESALVEALTSGALAGAGCDCLPGEPLPPTSRLWALPRLIITAHVGGQHPDYEERGMAIFAANLRRYCAGAALENLVDLEAGY